MRPPGGVTPAHRHPRPTFAGGIRNTGSLTTSLKTFGLTPGPTIGTAWELRGFSLTIVGPAVQISTDVSIDLLLNGEAIDHFTAAAALIVAGSASLSLPLTISHDFASPFTIYDTDSLQLRQNYAEQPDGTLNYLDYRYRGNVAYLD